MQPEDIALRNATYRLFVDLGRAPRTAEVAADRAMTTDEVASAWRRLHDEHALVLDDNGAILMAHPFSAVPTPYRVRAAGRWWDANCAWDALGIPAALHVPGEVETTCADCGEPISLRVDGVASDDGALLFHCLVPAAHWWDDVVFT